MPSFEARCTHHAEDGVGATRVFVHAGLSNMAGALALLQQLQNVLHAGDNVLTQARHIHSALLALVDLQLGAVR